jgi:hypothetical protein
MSIQKNAAVKLPFLMDTALQLYNKIMDGAENGK